MIHVSSDDLEWPWKGGREGSNFFFRRISIITLVPFDLERPNSRTVTVVGEGHISRFQLRPHLRGGPSVPKISETRCLRPYDLIWSDKIWRGNTRGEGRVSSGQVPRGESPAWEATTSSEGITDKSERGGGVCVYCMIGHRNRNIGGNS